MEANPNNQHENPNRRYNGVGKNLLCLAMCKSFDMGFDGFVGLHAKRNYNDLYYQGLEGIYTHSDEQDRPFFCIFPDRIPRINFEIHARRCYEVSRLNPFMFKQTRTGVLATRRREQDNLYSDIDDMDKAIPSGKYVLPGGKPPRIHLHEMYKYCQENGVSPQDLTPEQKKKFLY